MLNDRWHETSLASAQGINSHDLRPTQRAWSAVKVDDDLIWYEYKSDEDKRSAIFLMESYPSIRAAQERWYVMRDQAERLFAFDATVFTLLHLGTTEVYLGMLLATGDFEEGWGHGHPNPPEWWGDIRWPRPVYPTAYEHLV